MTTPIISIAKVTPALVEPAKALIMDAVYHDFGFSYNPDWHWDVDNLPEAYAGRNVMLTAQAGGELIGTIGLRAGAPVDIAGHFTKGDMRVAQIVRLVVRRDWRRRGVAKALVESLLPYAIQDPDTDQLYFHTSDTSANAMPFWLSLGATMIRDDRPKEPITRTVHFAFNLAALREGLPLTTPARLPQSSPAPTQPVA